MTLPDGNTFRGFSPLEFERIVSEDAAATLLGVSVNSVDRIALRDRRR